MGAPSAKCALRGALIISQSPDMQRMGGCYKVPAKHTARRKKVQTIHLESGT